MRLYAAVARGSFRRYATYRAATWAGVFTNTVFGFFIAYTYRALWEIRPHLGGYDLGAALTYVWLGQSLMVPVAAMGGGIQDDLEARITSGDIAVDLYRPVDQQGWWLAADLGRAGYHLLSRGVLPLAVGALFFRLRMPAGGAAEAALTWAGFLASLVLAVVVSFALRYMASLTGFWLLDARGVRQVTAVLGMFFSGFLLPLTLLPPALGAVAQHLPWAGMVQIPEDVFLQRRTGGALLSGLALQLLWALVLLGAGRLVQRAAAAKVVVQGG
ncbi:ABC transporter permease [Streptacidiphilus sp. PB12-B1b]|uniref:ABC transporter permease n=1 Tax=Streptacidiphilus sp. PB12-B1b TaxID=2705012 RepID=UPI0015FB65C3|nr:ABC-2 family transporter protein [Streptacidiphilus sp. PB12-B1b]QMU80066.1 ABC transporter permease [Streptacidiphilus sp. PB12-B1b]